jgi:1,4-alpha-glucan branching enzyme
VPAAHRAASATAGTAETPATVEVRAGGRLIIVAPTAETVDAMGDFTDWQPTPLVRTAEGRWEYPRPVAPGVHQFNVRLGGGAWIVPNGASAVDDGFGGRTGLVVVRP